MEVETAALANYMCSLWESSHTLSFTAALAIHTSPYNTSPGNMHIPSLCFVVYHLTLAVAVFIFHGKLDLNTCSVELPGAYLL